MFAEHFGKLTRVDARHSRHLFALEPVAEALLSIPVGILFAVVGDDYRRGIDSVTLHEPRYAILLYGELRHAIIAYKWIGKCHQLTGVRRVGEALRISHHCRIEHYFSGYRSIIAKTLTMETCSIA